MSTGGARKRGRDGTGSPGARYTAVQVATVEPAVPNGRRRIVGPRAIGGVLPDGIVVLLAVIVAAALIWGAIAGLAWVVWRLRGG